MDPSSGFEATGINKSELKNQELVVGAWRFELETSCAQGRRATRLRYAPTCSAHLILRHFPTLLLLRSGIFLPRGPQLREIHPLQRSRAAVPPVPPAWRENLCRRSSGVEPSIIFQCNLPVRG